MFNVAWRLRPDNFTPPSRTPWGGTNIVQRIKRGLPVGRAAASDSPVGEAWEVSTDSAFPSRLADHGGLLLGEAIAKDPLAALGAEVAGRHGNLPLLVKILDAHEPLSLQVHPAEGDPALGPGEGGKPESWFIYDAAPGAGVYVGFRAGVTRRDVTLAIETKSDLSALMNFVPVKRGDAFAIDPGVVHALGAGVTVVEPQSVTPGKSGVTYRFWDWNRRYDASGRPDANGSPRALHVERSLAVADFSVTGDAAVAKARRSGKHIEQGWLTAELQTGDAIRAMPGTLSAFVVLEGEVNVETAGSHARFQAGESFVLPAKAQPGAKLTSKNAWLIMTAPRAQT